MLKYDNCKNCHNANCEHYREDREFICPGGISCKVAEPDTITAPIFAVYTGNRFNQVLLFPTYDSAANWLRSATRHTEAEIPRLIKTTHFDGMHTSIMEV